jgi:hypothetical protein
VPLASGALKASREDIFSFFKGTICTIITRTTQKVKILPYPIGRIDSVPNIVTKRPFLLLLLQQLFLIAE